MPALLSRKLITVPRRAAGPRAEKRVLVTRTLRASAERLAASVRGALPVVDSEAGVVGGAAPGPGVPGGGRGREEEAPEAVQAAEAVVEAAEEEAAAAAAVEAATAEAAEP